MGKYESPLLEGGFLGMAGILSKNSSSSVDGSVLMVGLVIEAADEAGSTDGMLDRIDGIDTLERVRDGHLGGESGETGLDSS